VRTIDAGCGAITERNGKEHEQKGTEGNGAGAPAPPPPPDDDQPRLRPLAVAYCKNIRHLTNREALQELNQVSLEFERHNLYDEEIWTDAVESFATNRLQSYRDKHHKYPPLVYICGAIVKILEEQKRGQAA
jgi:hypothetical protein